jgi:hypothetical protein
MGQATTALCDVDDINKGSLTFESIWIERVTPVFREFEELMSKLFAKDPSSFERLIDEFECLADDARYYLDKNNCIFELYPDGVKVRFNGKGDFIKHNATTGMKYVAELLERPWQEIPANVLYSENLLGWDTARYDDANCGLGLKETNDMILAQGGYHDDLAASSNWDNSLKSIPMSRDEIENADPSALEGVMDPEDLRQVRKMKGHIAKLKQKPQTPQVKKEIAEIEKYLNNNFRGGRFKEESPLDKHRASVKKAIDRAVEAIGKEHPDLGIHLRTAIKTGKFCSYNPDRDSKMIWEVDQSGLKEQETQEIGYFPDSMKKVHSPDED